MCFSILFLKRFATLPIQLSSVCKHFLSWSSQCVACFCRRKRLDDMVLQQPEAHKAEGNEVWRVRSMGATARPMIDTYSPKLNKLSMQLSTFEVLLLDDETRHSKQSIAKSRRRASGDHSDVSDERPSGRRRTHHAAHQPGEARTIIRPTPF